ncbi:nicastrin [Elysia marginata]|uniref:Nicastrin n=1 Tax=Elysia marginata TaxID=1093978 RepID=A0AAV4GA69_9GAST|nr:nicastrin [Elysia marginata]
MRIIGTPGANNHSSVSAPSADSVRTKTKIYIDLKTKSACFRHLNATHQLGCASSQKGNVGVVYFIQSPTDFDWVLTDGPHAPYMVVVDSVDFTG